MTDIQDYHARGLIPDLETQMQIEQLLEQNQGANLLDMGYNFDTEEQDEEDDGMYYSEEGGSRMQQHVYG